MRSFMKARGAPTMPAVPSSDCSQVKSMRECQTGEMIRQGWTFAAVVVAVAAMSLLCTTEESYRRFLQWLFVSWTVLLVYFSYLESPSINNTGSEVDCTDRATWVNAAAVSKRGRWARSFCPVLVAVLGASKVVEMCRSEVGQTRLFAGLACFAVLTLTWAMLSKVGRCPMCGPNASCREMCTVPEADLQGGEIKLGGPRTFHNDEFGFRLQVQEGSLGPDTENIDPVKLRHVNEAAFCDGSYLYVMYVAVFGPKGVTFNKPLLLCMEAREGDTPVFTKGGGVWHKCDKSKVREVYPCHRRVRHFLVEVDHFCSYGVAMHPIRCRDITSGTFWSKKTSRFFTPRKLEALDCTPPHPDSALVVGKLLCIVVPLRWVDRILSGVSANVTAPGGGGVEMEGTFDVHRVELPGPNSFSPYVFMKPGITWGTHIPQEMGSSVGVILARVYVDEDDKKEYLRVIQSMYVEVGQRVEVDLSKMDIESSMYRPIQLGAKNMMLAVWEAVGLRAPSTPNGAALLIVDSSNGSSSAP